MPTSKWLGVALITLGVGGLFAQSLSAHGTYIQGDLCLLAGSFCWGLFSVLIKRWQISPWEATVSLAIITSLIYLPIYVLFLPMTLSVDLWSDIVVQAFYQGFLATIIQMIFYVRAVQLIGPSSMGALMAIVPVLSGVAALFVFQEPVTFALCTAFVLVSLGAWCASGKLLLPRVGAPREKENSEETLVQ